MLAASDLLVRKKINTSRGLAYCPVNTLLGPPANFRAGQGAPTRHNGHYGEEAQRRPARKGAAQRVRYSLDRALAVCASGARRTNGTCAVARGGRPIH